MVGGGGIRRGRGEVAGGDDAILWFGRRTGIRRISLRRWWMMYILGSICGEGEDLRASTAAQRWLAGVLGFGEFEQIRVLSSSAAYGGRG